MTIAKVVLVTSKNNPSNVVSGHYLASVASSAVKTVIVLTAFYWSMSSFGVSSENLWAATRTAVSCAQSDVAQAVASATDGDVVMIPPCPGGVSWTIRLDINKAITLQGAGMGQTVLIDNVTKGTPTCQGISPMITVNVPANLPWRLTGMTIRGGVTDPYICNKGHINVIGGSHSFRIDHIEFNPMRTSAIRPYGDLWGVIDHNMFIGDHQQGVLIFHERWGGVGAYGDNSWAQPSSLGTEQAIFLEDNTFIDDHAQGAGATDIFAGGRMVVRYNKLSFLGTHGTESGGRFRGIRQFEVYNNTFTSQTGGSASGMYLRGGTGVFFNNTFQCKNNDCVNHPYTNMLILENDRDRDPFAPWGTCDGTSAFDKNDGSVYAFGQHNGPSGASNILTDSSKGWTPNQWNQGYTVRNVTRGWSSVISSNTANTATTQASIYGTSRIWNSGDAYQISRAYPCIDQVGRGAGPLLSGDAPSPAVWPNQILDPIYHWNNNLAGNGAPTISTSTTHAIVNRDFYNNTPKPGYVPFVYPHPLVGGSANAPPSPPQNLTVR